MNYLKNSDPFNLGEDSHQCPYDKYIQATPKFCSAKKDKYIMEEERLKSNVMSFGEAEMFLMQEVEEEIFVKDERCNNSLETSNVKGGIKKTSTT